MLKRIRRLEDELKQLSEAFHELHFIAEFNSSVACALAFDISSIINQMKEEGWGRLECEGGQFVLASLINHYSIALKELERISNETPSL